MPRKSDYLTPCTLSEFLPALSLFLACCQIMKSSLFLEPLVDVVILTFPTLLWLVSIWFPRPAYYQIVFLENRVGDFCFLFPFSNNRHFFKGSADDLPRLTLSYCHKRTNARVKNLRRVFLVELVKKQMRCLSFSSAHS